MNGPGGTKASLRRTLFAFAVACLFALQGLLAAIAISCPMSEGGDAFETALAASICGQADDGAGGGDHSAPTHPHHCLLCSAHAGCAGRDGDVVATAVVWSPPLAAVARPLAHEAQNGPHPQSGRAGSWSPRAPPFNA